MSLDQAVRKLKLDSRLVEIYLANGQLTKEEYETYLKTLPDCSAQSAPITLEDDKPSTADVQAH
ncbi:MAG: hypothetical protein ACK5P7_07425 [Bdellovibrio sp.]